MAPAFLLTAIATYLTLLMNRLWRILDQARALQEASPGSEALSALLKRANLVYRAISASVGAGIA